MLAETEVHGDGKVDGQRVNPALRLRAPAYQGGDLQVLAGGQSGADLAENLGIEGALLRSGIEVDLHAADAGEVRGLKHGIGCGTAGGCVVLEGTGRFDTDDSLGPDGARRQNPLMAANDFYLAADEDALGEKGDADMRGVRRAQVLRFLPGPQDDGRRAGQAVRIGCRVARPSAIPAQT